MAQSLSCLRLQKYYFLTKRNEKDSLSTKGKSLFLIRVKGYDLKVKGYDLRVKGYDLKG